MFTVSGFNTAFRGYSINSRLRHLTVDTFDHFMKLYVDIHKTIKDYNSFTYARSQGRVPMLSTPEASRSRYIPPDLPEPDEEETSKLWRGFLLYELVCRTSGVPRAMAAGLGNTPRAAGLLDPTRLCRTLPLYKREEASCVLEYFQSQYDLAFNCLLEKFESAVGELHQQSRGSSPHHFNETRPIIELLEVGSYGSGVSYLTKICRDGSRPWAVNAALLGASFLQQYLSWDSSCRLDFVRATYYPLCRRGDLYAYWALGCPLNRSLLSSEGFGWSCQPEDELDMYENLEFTPCEDRMRSVGWIFWKNPDRLWLMNLGSSQEYEMSSEHYEVELGKVHSHLRLQVRSHLLEAPVQRQDWELVVQRFRATNEWCLHDDMKDLLMATGEPGTCTSADIASVLGRQDVGGILSEAKASGS